MTPGVPAWLPGLVNRLTLALYSDCDPQGHEIEPHFWHPAQL